MFNGYRVSVSRGGRVTAMKEMVSDDDCIK